MLYIRESFDCTALIVSKDVAESLRVKIWRMENKENVAVGVYYRSPSRDVGTDELFYKQLREISVLIASKETFLLPRLQMGMSFCCDKQVLEILDVCQKQLPLTGTQ